jgi:8-oxo-dGTP diphosphatase
MILNPKASVYAEKLRTRICGICIHDNKLLLIRHASTVNKENFWAPPGGGLSYGETIEQCLVREILEETGLEVKVGRFLFVNEFLHPPLHAVEFFFEVQLTGGTLTTGVDPELAPDQQIIEEACWLDIKEIIALPIASKHRSLQYLISLDDLLGQDHYFIRHG